MDIVKHMKWWGWGEEGVSFQHEDKPAFAAFVKSAIDIDVSLDPEPVQDLAQMEVPQANVPSELILEFQRIVGIPCVRQESLDRVVHAYGKGLRDLVRIRRGDFGRLPDVVVYPSCENEVIEIINAALSANAVLVPFGGGTNIAGSLEAPRNEN